mgnify:CR=1 FL=1
MKGSQRKVQSTESQVLRRILGRGRGAVFVPAGFLDLGSRLAIDLALHRLVKKGTLRRLARGVYDFPRVHGELGPLWPSAENVAGAIAGRDGIRLQPAGAYAANLLGLTEQVPAKVVFLTDGPTRSVRVGPTVIQLRHTTPKNMAAAGRLSGLVIQALRHLKREHVTAARVARLKATLPARERRSLARDIKLAPTWMHPILRELAKD